MMEKKRVEEQVDNGQRDEWLLVLGKRQDRRLVVGGDEITSVDFYLCRVVNICK